MEQTYLCVQIYLDVSIKELSLNSVKKE